MYTMENVYILRFAKDCLTVVNLLVFVVNFSEH